jgi:hypothetical protein
LARGCRTAPAIRHAAKCLDPILPPQIYINQLDAGFANNAARIVKCRPGPEKWVSFRDHPMISPDLKVEPRRLIAVGHAVIANDADLSMAQLAEVRSGRRWIAYPTEKAGAGGSLPMQPIAFGTCCSGR